MLTLSIVGLHYNWKHIHQIHCLSIIGWLWTDETDGLVC